MRPLIFDSTAGMRAREISAHPGVPLRILDPTDPRYGELALGGEAQRIFDPTDRRCGQLAA